ncbi:MAG: AbrB/MazE/SpoVT family DNA-binding domain-containing protein [Firmicutes bacterium]|nr:AbrB/MazE/SpoVT family DNA-binding domain-containing protein [Bacillota bacterium]MBR6585710.1 AbrB/MazE/SpoVT family DNA-binding domain-containing protein [Bacillota bacterium]
MLAELRQKSQITIPKEIVEQLGLNEGDKLEIYVNDGMICIMPVAVYPKKYLEELRGEISVVRENIENGRQPLFDNVDALFERLEMK